MKRWSFLPAVVLMFVLASSALAQGIAPTTTPTPLTVRSVETSEVTVTIVTPERAKASATVVSATLIEEPCPPIQMHNLPYRHMTYGFWVGWSENGQEVKLEAVCPDGTLVVTWDNGSGAYFLPPENDAENHYELRIGGQDIKKLVGKTLWVDRSLTGRVVIAEFAPAEPYLSYPEP